MNPCTLECRSLWKDGAKSRPCEAPSTTEFGNALCSCTRYATQITHVTSQRTRHHIAASICGLNNDGGRLRSGDLVHLGNRAGGVLRGGIRSSGEGFDVHGTIRRNRAFLMRPGRAAGDDRRGGCRERDRPCQRRNPATGLTRQSWVAFGRGHICHRGYERRIVTVAR